jgi:acetyl-CoA acetyltransferase
MTGAAGRVAVVGVGYTDFVAASPHSVLELAREASSAAVLDAGLTATDVDGIASFMVMHDSVPTQAVATALAVGEVRFSLDVDMGGQAPCHLVAQAAAAISSGQAETVIVYRAMKGRSGPRVGGMEFAGGGGQYRYPIGYSAYMMYVAMWARRFLHETGQDEHDLGAVAMAQREYALRNARAFRRKPLSPDDYAASPMVVDPFRAADCTIEVDGACAVVLTSLERARDLRHPPAVVASGGYRAGPRSGLDIGDHLRWTDYSRNYTSWLADDLFRRAGVSVGDVQFAEIYDCFTSTVLMGMEGLGLCGRGESGAFVRSGATGLDGSLPTNTHGGLLAEGYLHGMNTVNEAVLQIQGRGGDRQVPRHEVCVVTSGAMMDGSGLVLTTDR